jgi:ADP-heptose:LPS heptosyltransferase
MDLMAIRAGLYEVADKRLVMHVPDEDAAWAADERKRWKRHPLGGRRCVGIQLSASSPVRDWPEAHVMHLARIVHRMGHTVVFFGRPGQSRVIEEPGVVNGPARGWTLGQSLAVLATMDCVVAPDSGLLHCADALDVPSVGIYGSFNPDLRTRYHKHCTVITGGTGIPCAPCGHHSRGWMTWPEQCPGKNARECLALHQVKPEAVAQLVQGKLNKRPAAAP